MSLNLYLGPRHSVLVETPDHARMIRLESPVLLDEELEELKQVAAADFKPATISTLFDVGTSGNGDSAGSGRCLLDALDRIVRECAEAVEKGSSILILSDRGVNAQRAAVPMLLAVGAVVEGLIAAGVGNKADLVLETAEAWEAHHFACLVGKFAARDLFAQRPLPGFDNSAMDGYAVVAESCRAGTRLRVVGEQPAGEDRGLDSVRERF